MKQTLLKLTLMAALALLALDVSAADVDADAARRLASRFLNSQSSGKLRSSNAELRLAHVEPCATDASLADFYVFNTSDDGAFVIVAGEDCAQSVLGYGNGAFDMENVPVNVRWWLDGYKKQIEFMRAHADEAVAGPRPSRVPIQGGNVEPLLTCQWSQSEPYYNQCPVYEGRLCVTGCVATALAQVVYYWKYPAELPSLPAYATNTYGIPVSALPAVALDWEHMLDYYDYQYGDEEAAAVATLMRYCGQACYMDYSPDGSGAYEVDQLSALLRFGYSNSATLVQRDECDDAEWEQMLLEDLQANCPVLYIGRDNDSGHAFVLDGYNGDMYHVNWGWGGHYDGYFAIDALGGSGWEYNYDQVMIHGVCPDAGSNAVAAYDFEQDGIYYLANGDELTVTLKDHQFNGYSGDVSIPSQVTHEGKTYRVTTIGEGAFMNCAEVTSVSIPSGVTAIKAYAFKNCQALRQIHIGSSMQSIGRGAFNSCVGLENVDIDDVAAWCSIEFADMNSSPIRYAGKLSIGGQPVSDLVIPGKVDKINYCAFAYLRSITSLTIEEGVSEIGEVAFYLCNNLRSVKIPGSVKKVGYCAFLYDDALENITLNEGVEYIDEFAFYELPSLKSINIPASVKWVGNAAFAFNPGLEDVTFNGPLALDTYAFYKCTALNRVNISSIADWCATACADETSNPLTYAHSLYMNGEEVENLEVTGEVTAIGDFAFNECRSLKRVVIDGDVATVGQGAFQYCTALQELVIGDAVQAIGEKAFYACTTMAQATIGSGLETLSEKAFGSCVALTSISLSAVMPPAIAAKNCFTNSVYKRSLVRVPTASLDAYKTADIWKEFKRIEAQPSLVLVGDLDDDGEVTVSDLTIELAALRGQYDSAPRNDINGDGEVNIADVNALIDLIIAQ